MKTLDHEYDSLFRDVVRRLIAGDFSRLDPLFEGRPCQINKCGAHNLSGNLRNLTGTQNGSLALSGGRFV